VDADGHELSAVTQNPFEKSAECSGLKYERIVMPAISIKNDAGIDILIADSGPGSGSLNRRGNRSVKLQHFIYEKQIGQQRPQMDRSVQIIDQLRTDRRLGQY
jgi:hypothetical protein